MVVEVAAVTEGSNKGSSISLSGCRIHHQYTDADNSKEEGASHSLTQDRRSAVSRRHDGQVQGIVGGISEGESGRRRHCDDDHVMCEAVHARRVADFARVVGCLPHAFWVEAVVFTFNF